MSPALLQLLWLLCHHRGFLTGPSSLFAPLFRTAQCLDLSHGQGMCVELTKLLITSSYKANFSLHLACMPSWRKEQGREQLALVQALAFDAMSSVVPRGVTYFRQGEATVGGPCGSTGQVSLEGPSAGFLGCLSIGGGCSAAGSSSAVTSCVASRVTSPSCWPPKCSFSHLPRATHPMTLTSENHQSF